MVIAYKIMSSIRKQQNDGRAVTPCVDDAVRNSPPPIIKNFSYRAEAAAAGLPLASHIFYCKRA